MASQLPTPPPEPERRGSRIVKLTQRARESDDFSNMSKTLARLATPTASSTDVDSVTRSTSSPDPISQAHSTVSEVPRTAFKRKVIRKVTKYSARKACNKGDSIHVAARPIQKDLLSKLHLQIYPWPTSPTTVADFTKNVREWKQKYDQYEESRDIDEELDDWFVKCGNPAAYSDLLRGASLAYSVARSFILRAKRAFRARLTFAQFEDTELAIDSMSQAYAVQDPVLRALHIHESVDNDLRLDIYEQIRERLCFEIWLERLPADRIKARRKIEDRSLNLGVEMTEEESRPPHTSDGPVFVSLSFQEHDDEDKLY